MQRHKTHSRHCQRNYYYTLFSLNALKRIAIESLFYDENKALNKKTGFYFASKKVFHSDTKISTPSDTIQVMPNWRAKCDILLIPHLLSFNTNL